MANLNGITVNGLLTTSEGVLRQTHDFTPWYRIYHCADADNTSICNPVHSCGYIHIRTPLPADEIAPNTQKPSMLEVVGFHTYTGDYTHYFKSIVNTDASNNFTAQTRVNLGNEDIAPYVYRSSSAYGGYRRVCFSMRKVGCCCVGWMWVRWRVNASLYSNYPWGVTADGSSTTIKF